MKKKIIPAILLLAMLGLNLGGFLFPKKTQAQVPVIDAAHIGTSVANTILEIAKMGWKYVMDNASRWAIKVADWLWQEALATLLAILKKKILDMLTNEIVMWIQGGGEQGPKFITNWWDFLGLAANEAEHKFSRQLSASEACAPFKSILIKSFAPSGEYNGLSGFVGKLDNGFNQRIKCTFEEQAGTSFENFFKDFRYGGWDGWISITEPQNNFYGAYLLAMDEKLGLMNKAQEAAQNKGIANSGWLGDERCTTCSLYDDKNNQIGSATGVKACENLSNEIPPGGSWQCDKREIYTPGDAIGSLAAEAITSEMDWVKNIDSKSELGAYLTAIANALINRVIGKGLSFLNPRGDGRSDYTSSNPEPPAEEAPVGSINLSDSTITLQTGESENIVVTVWGTDGKPVVGYLITPEISDPSVIMISPTSMITDSNGQIVFSVTAISVTDTDPDNPPIITFKAGGKTPQTTVNVTALPGPEEPADNPGETPEIPGSPVGI
ncbi:MAG: hypothetical protein A3D38_01780 [Candidatus Portnoybacteria bacterium RIFCSPHIGHO2_02_FULL_40_23]|uniref:Uncharacterized protein n=1 Tax=Candidatus Portnoybacteria bacterium RIFCSPLOWO2_02_FULL_40_15 TaxID=1802002 RepID=A0A1G2FTE8_9BACT|nr:MAG: hypothetical protein A3D38_01780 [Candidatus Portnoybacteria bacterium RIFCSPHIGHO2_02_FULL_40_23]OGZ40910.1 MAG: hypothetical protein A3I20_01690 [Candidatus Portnoybacteria bacterium RIFCSPLOWO2_02_FULL_40_15]